MIYGILKTKIGTTGTIAEEYGGFEIIVIDKAKFPWFDVFDLLIEHGFQIWINKKENHIQILSKPEVD